MNRSFRILIGGLSILLLGIAVYYLYCQQRFLQRYVDTLVQERERSQAARAQHEQRLLPRVTSSWMAVHQRVRNTVVQVLSELSQFNWLEPYKTPAQQETAGSGFFINADGYLVTNYHVIAQARNIEIRLPYMGQERFEVEVVGASPERDIALLRLKPESRERFEKQLGGTIPYLALGDSDVVGQAQDVMALGYPLGQENAKSTIGNVSGREKLGFKYYIQITAPLNPGNSGGPCLNTDGEVVGVNTAGIMEAQNVGYIVPINEVKSALNDLYKVKLLRKPMLGALFTPSTEEMVTYFNNPPEGGWYIARVFPNTILEKVGIQEGDMLYELNGHKVDMYGDIFVAWSDDKVSLLDLLNRFVVGDKIHMVIYRQGKRHDIHFKLEPRYLLPVRKMYPDFETIDYEVFGGMCVMQLSLNHVALFLAQGPALAPSLAKYASPEHQYERVLVVTNMFPDSVAKKTKLIHPGMIINEVNGKKVETLTEFRDAVKLSKKSAYLTIKSLEENRFAVMRISDILRDEDRLSSVYFYKKSKLVSELLSWMS